MRRYQKLLFIILGVSLFLNTVSVSAYLRFPSFEFDEYYYATYLGGVSDDIIREITVDSTGNMIVVGSTYSEDFPILDAYQMTYAGGVSESIHEVGGEGFVSMFSREEELIWSTFLGGSGLDGCLNVEILEEEIVVSGVTDSTDFPIVGELGQQAYGGGKKDGFIVVYSAEGELIRSSYFGGSDEDSIQDITLNGKGNLVLTGYTMSDDLPVTGDPYQSGNNGELDAFIVIMNPENFQITYLTYFGGSDREGAGDISSGPNDSIFITGFTNSSDFPVTEDAFQNTIVGPERDIFLVRFSEDGQMEYATYIGGSDMDDCLGLDVDSDVSAILSGRTWSSDFPTVNAIQSEYSEVEVDGFVSKFSPDGGSLIFSTFLGYSGWDTLHRVCVDDKNNIILAGISDSNDFPVINAFQSTKKASLDIYIIMLDPEGNPLFSSYLGGNRGELPWSLVYEEDVLYISAHVSSDDIITSDDAFQNTLASGEDCYIFRFNLDRYIEDQPIDEEQPPEPSENEDVVPSYWTSYIVVVGFVMLIGIVWFFYSRR